MIETLVAAAARALSCTVPDSDRIGSLIRDFLRDVHARTVAVYPAGYSGRALAKTLAGYGIPVACFVDRSADTLRLIDGTPVFEPARLTELPPDTLLCISANLNGMVEQLSTAARQANARLEIVNGFYLNRLLKHPGCTGQLTRRDPFDLIECEHCGFERHGCSVLSAYLYRVGRATPLVPDWRSASFTWFGYIVGQACTLNCVHCCEAVPFLKNHRFVPKEVILSDVQKVAAASRFLTFVELVGGEPFLHPEFETIVEDLLEIRNIGYIKSFTNGTIVPSDRLCRALKHPRFMLQLSNYERQANGKLLQNILATRTKLQDHGIDYVFTQNFEWQDFTSFDLHHTDAKKLESIFNACTLRNCNRLHHGTLYRCPHQYAGVELGVLQKLPVESVSIDRYGERDLSAELERFENVSYIDACRHCLMPFDAPPVPAGIQISAR